MDSFLLWLGANAVKGSVVTVIVFFVILFFSRKIPPRYRYTLWYLAAIRFIMLPVFFVSFSFFTLAPSFIPDELPVIENFIIEQETNMSSASPVSNNSNAEKNWTVLTKENISVILFGIWALGAFGLTSLFILRNIWGHSLTKGLKALEDKKISVFINECCKHVNINRKFTLHETELTGSPVLLGIFKPKLLLPKNFFNKLHTQELRYVILHELMHLKKNDILINWFFGIVCALHWFNPLAWYAFARMKSDREEARDADVLALLNKNELKEYGGLILKLSTLCGSGANFSESVGIMEKNKKIKRRIIMIKNFRIMSRWNTLLALILIAGVGIFCLSEAKSKKAPMSSNDKKVVRFIKQLNDKDARVRSKATFTLGKLRDKRSVEALIKALKDKDIKVRANAAYALRWSRDKRVVEPLVKLLNDNDSSVRVHAAGALLLLGDKRAVEPLVKLLNDNNLSIRVRTMGALALFGDRRAVEPALELLKDKNSWTRLNAAIALGRLNDKRAIEPLVKLLKDKNGRVRASAAYVLGKLRDKRAFVANLKFLKDKDSRVRASAAFALGYLRDKRAFEPLIKALKDKDSRVRRGVAFALGKLRDKRVVAPLIKALKDEDSSVRASAARALWGHKGAAEPLVQAFERQ